MSKVLKSIALLVIFTLVLAACGGGDEETPTPAATQVPAATVAPASTEAPVATVAPTATEVPVATESAEVTVATEITSTQAMTSAEAVTSTEMATSTEAITATEEVTTTEESTATTEGAATENVATENAATVSGGVHMVLMPKAQGVLVFDQAYQGAMEAHAELGNTGALEFLGPKPENGIAGQIEILTTAITNGVDVMMLSNNAGEQISPVAQAASDAGMIIVTWDSPIPSATGEQIFVSQVDNDETGTVMADMALSILGDDGGQFAILSTTPDAANQNAWLAALNTTLQDPKYANLELVDTVYGKDQSMESYNQALALVDKYPDLELIMAPTTVGIAAAAKAMQDNGLCSHIKVSGLGLPAEMVSYTLNGCAPEFALWSFVDLGYLTYQVAYQLATGAITAEAGQTFTAGRMGDYTIEQDPTRPAGLRVLMGPFTIYTPDNVEEAAQ